ncbi:MAG: sugar transferase [Suipraeoptans sp.]
MLKPWEQLPDFMKIEEVKPYYYRISRRTLSLVVKRTLDFVLSILLTIILSPVMLIVAIWIKTDSPGPIFYKQMRITQYGKRYRIYKFRTMYHDTRENKQLITGKNDSRITKVGEKIRHSRIDELPQLFNILKGEMSFVGTRPEVEKYVSMYTPEMMATLLLPAGVTSIASIKYKDETEVIDQYTKKGMEIDEIYEKVILPEKMKFNIEYLNKFGLPGDIKVLFQTVFAVLKKGDH